ncbi:MAG TPA: sigma-70 family RNA polymerase sigma factor [Blastocatellia bacterium]|nr:sigma-70 family RNA polymerase sigma factor [Blastocatellia bacterium]
MENTPAADIFETTTRLLKAWSEGDETALEQLVPLVDAELRRLARHYLQQERPGHILQTTALVNEAWVRLINWPDVSWQNRAHFIGLAAQLMRRVLVDLARRRQAQKYGADALHVSLANAEGIARGKSEDLVALDDALNELARFDERQSRIVELRFFGGLSMEETAEVLKISARTVQREWSLAQAWLYRELSRGV